MPQGGIILAKYQWGFCFGVPKALKKITNFFLGNDCVQDFLAKKFLVKNLHQM